MLRGWCGLSEPALESERVSHLRPVLGVEVAIQYAVAGKKVVLSSRSEGKLKEVQQEIVKRTGKPESEYPIVLVDVEKDEEFPSAVDVIRRSTD